MTKKKDKIIQVIYHKSVGDLYGITEEGNLYSFRIGDKEWKFVTKSPIKEKQ